MRSLLFRLARIMYTGRTLLARISRRRAPQVLFGAQASFKPSSGHSMWLTRVVQTLFLPYCGGCRLVRCLCV
ncbi:hypothetical protein EDB80DRAFT_741472 [Ilyonectria destructans]|nr:hypothetical protein EDB80DRAFT_741472 [Ilyonectria destructans]